MMLKIFNTLTRKKEKFTSMISGIIKIYVCGMTVYDLCHLGHGRTFVIFDMITRYLRYSGYRVNYVRNITDIDDKIIKRACKNNETTKQLTDRMIQEMHIDLDQLCILRPNYEPRVTEYLDSIISYIHILIKNKYAYILPNGDVKFSINKIYDYGILSNRKRNISIANTNSRSNIKNFRMNSMDFVLWKRYKPGEPYWKSPWGYGRPGWHIECSAISHAILGNNLDIHGGGLDLIFPHHENERAQSTCAYHSCINIWMHTGMMLSINNEKMSKSLGNFITIRDVLNHYDYETIRYFLMSAHYRSQLQYSSKNLKNARTSLESLYRALHGTDFSIPPSGGNHYITKFTTKMNDDFNTPEAYAVLFEIAHEINNLKLKNYKLAQGMASTLRYLANILGILNQNPDVFLKRVDRVNNHYLYSQVIQKLVEKRKKARQNHQWDIADKIRQKLILMGVVVEDESTGITRWYYLNKDI